MIQVNEKSDAQKAESHIKVRRSRWIRVTVTIDGNSALKWPLSRMCAKMLS